MMKDVIIKIDQNSMVYKQETVLGISYENLQGKIIFKFLGTFPKGIAYLEYERDTEKGYLQMNQVGEEYQLEIKSSLLTKEGRIYLQLRVTEDATPEGIPVFKSNKFYLEVKEAINATAEIPDEYPEWIDTANEKIKEMDNLNITTERVEDGVDIVLTDKKGNTTRTEVKDGAPGPQGPQGEPGAVKMQVVDTLPATGETDTIYLVKKSNPGEQNLYDEYVYANGAWEHIGDTSVDLTDYYTKEESDRKLNEKQNTLTPGDNITIENNVISASGGLPELLNQEIDLTSIETGAYIISGTNTVIKTGDFVHRGIFVNNQSRAILIACKVNNSGFGTGILIEGDFKSGVYGSKRSRIILYNYDGYDVLDATNILFKNNTITYTPTADYHPATKKYVDDNVKTYTAGDNIKISEDNVISASGGDINDVGIYTWVYSDFPNTTNYDLKTKYNDFFKNMVNDAYSKGKKGIILTKTGNSTSGLNDKYQYTFTALNCDLQLKPTIIAFYGNPLTTSMNFYQRVNFQYAQIRIGGTWTDNTFEPQYIYWDGITTVSFLSVDNMWNYTPTNNYNPSTKLYTDKTHYEKMTGYDATKTQVLKNINGTLTWVDEV